MSRTFRRLNLILKHRAYPCGPYRHRMDPTATGRRHHREIGDHHSGYWSVPSAFTHAFATVPLRRYTRQAIHRAWVTAQWDGFSLPRKWPRPYYW